MSQPVLYGTFQEVAATLSPTLVSEYLAATGRWELESKTDQVREIWALPASDGSSASRVMLPLASDYADFDQRFCDALVALGRIYNWGASELQQHIVSLHADMLVLRLDQALVEETVPLAQAQTTIDALYEMFEAAAAAAGRPYSRQTSALTSQAAQFLSEEIRLGHTRRGSFAFTVLTGLDHASESAPEAASSDSHYNFSRQVMETLARGLESIRRLVDDQNAIGQRLSQVEFQLRLIELLERIARPTDFRSVELTFQWATSMSRPRLGSDAPIRIDQAGVSTLVRARSTMESVVAEALPQVTQPPSAGSIDRERPSLDRAQYVTIVGQVISITRNTAAPEDSASIVIAPTNYGPSRKVHVIVSGRDHELAILAYQEKLPLMVAGYMIYERRKWHIVGDMQVHLETS